MTTKPLDRETDELRWQRLKAELEQRNSDPTYADAPVLDAYARISFNPATGETEKTDRQLADVLANMVSRHCRLGEVLRDDSKSAWQIHVRRPGWDRLLERAESRSSNGLICWHTDRLTRQPFDLESLVRLAIGTDFMIGSCYGDFPVNDEIALTHLRFMVIMAENQSAAMSRRMKRGWQAKREQGLRHQGQRGFGFPAGRSAKNQVPNERVQLERECLIWAVGARIEGATTKEISDEWARRGLVSANGAPISSASVRGIITADRLAAIITHYGTPVAKASAEEPMVSEDELMRVRSTFQVTRSGPSARYLGGGLIYCGRCSNRMSGVQFKGTKRLYRDGVQRFSYRCSNVTGCGKNEIDGRTVDAWLRQEILDELTDPAHARMIVRRSDALARVEKEIDAAEQMLNGLADQFKPQGKFGGGIADATSALAALSRMQNVMQGWEGRRDELVGERNALLAGGAGAKVDRVLTVMELASKWDSEHFTLTEKRRMLIEALPYGSAVMPAVKEEGRPYPPPATRLLVLSSPGDRPPLGRV